MSIKFMTGSIKLGKSKSLVEMVKEATASKNVVKTAQVLQIVPEVSVDSKESVLHSHNGELEGHEEKKSCDCPCACESEVEVLPEESEIKELVMASKKELPAFIQQKIDAKKEKQGDKKQDEKKEQKKEASSSQFVKIAKLNKASKDLLRAEFEAIYPKDFVDAMLAEY